RQNSTMKRREALAKLTGRERYVDDLPLQDFLWGMTVRSPAPRGRVTATRFGKDVDWSQFVVVDHRDIPGPNVVALIEQQHRLVDVTHVIGREHRLLLLDQGHDVRSRDVAVVHHDELRPVGVLAEPDGGDAPAWRGAPHRHAPEEVLEWEIVHVPLAAGELGECLAALH